MEATLNNLINAYKENKLTSLEITDMDADNDYNGRVNKGHSLAVYNFLSQLYWRNIISMNTPVRIYYKHVKRGSDVIACTADRFAMTFSDGSYLVRNTETGRISEGGWGHVSDDMYTM